MNDLLGDALPVERRNDRPEAAALEALQGTDATHAELLTYIAGWAPGPKEGQGP